MRQACRHARLRPQISFQIARSNSLLIHHRRPYYSEHHPEPPPFKTAESAILTAALNRVPVYGFTSQALSIGAKDASFLEVSVQLLPRGVYDLINFHLVTQRLALKDRVQFPEDAELGVGKKIRTLTLERLRANKDIIQHWQGVRAFSFLVSPTTDSQSYRHWATCRCSAISRPLSKNLMPFRTKYGILPATPALTRLGTPSAPHSLRFMPALSFL